MQEFDETTITKAVLARVAGAENPRVAEISASLVRHLHAFVREVEPTEEEWEVGIRFLTETGQMCSSTRQEFILLSDVLGVSMLVDAINHRFPEGATETTVFGPFYVEPQEYALGSHIEGPIEGVPMHVWGTIRNTAGEPVKGAPFDVWHSDAEGFYDLQKQNAGVEFSGRARLRTDSRGRFHFWTVRPAPYPIPNDGPVGKMLEQQGRHPYRPEHIHFMIQAPGHRKLVTHLFAAGDPYLDSDVVFGVKNSLVHEFVPHEGGTAPDGSAMDGSWFSLYRDFHIVPDNH